ncbi:oxidoreductase [Pseudomonas sp. 43NM1]|uniref:carboxylic acid reductase n=1 Tax=Pseudomonas sp. 43NM1 TaxID=1904755 RepID=UPI000C325A75|nr:carboxylic acid reductase [Pseudomonas sp. 43NM1]PKH14641.1 oxidoreductase [Pseudomonas sp. 43NM1]
MSLAKIVADTMSKYADRPAIGERDKIFITDDSSQEVSLKLLPSYGTITYGELWKRTGALAAELHHSTNAPLTAGSSVAFLAFTSGDYAILDLACIRLGAIVVPLQTGSSQAQIDSILQETEPLVFATSIDYLDIAVEVAIKTPSIRRILLLDYYSQISEHSKKLNAVLSQLDSNSSVISIEPLQDLIKRGTALSEPPMYSSSTSDEELSMLIYTSGSTGTPKGAMYTQKLASGMWGGSWATIFSEERAITFHYMPMSHVAGHSSLKSTLARGGTCYFTAKSNLSTLLEDISLSKPTELSLVPRICEMIYQKYQTELARKRASHGDDTSLTILEDIRVNILGGQVGWASCSSAPLSNELKIFTESLLNIPLHNVYGSTEAGAIWIDNELLSPPVEDYRIIDVPELGYYGTDSPFPRGELLLKTQSIIPGYYKRPELASELFDEHGYYKTGDIVAETGHNRLVYVDRRKNVIKLSQGEFVATAKLETIFSAIPEIQSIFVYGKSEWSYLLAVVVPSKHLAQRFDGKAELIKQFIGDAIRKVAKTSELRSYEIPRDLLIDNEPFTQTNGLLSDHGKPLWPKLREKYASQLEELNIQLVSKELNELHDIHERINQQTVLETLKQAVRSLVGGATEEISSHAQFRELGGDSLSAVSLASILSDAYGITIPVDMLISPAYDLQHVSDYIEKTLHSGQIRPSAASIHGAKPNVFNAKDLSLQKFISPDILEKAQGLKPSSNSARTILLTGSTGYLGRFLCLQLLEEFGETGGKLICVVRGKNVALATKRLYESFGSANSQVSRKLRSLSTLHLEVLAGDIGEPKLGLDPETWDKLGKEVDTIVHAGALVNHVLPYSNLFDANVTGTAEIISLALSNHLKPVVFLSSIAVASLVNTETTLDEDADIRIAAAEIEAEDTYAAGYALSKWASEVLLREAHSHYGLPVTTFRSSMILAHSQYPGQLNVPDMFTRLLLSVALTGIAPPSFYRATNNVGLPHYDGLPVDFTASAILKIGVKQHTESYRSFNLVNPHDDGISLDTFVGWMTDHGVNIRKIADYADWYNRLETALLGLPERLKQHSILPLMHGFSEPAEVISGSTIPSNRFQEAVETFDSGSGAFAIPHISESLIRKYVTDLQSLGLLGDLHKRLNRTSSAAIPELQL